MDSIESVALLKFKQGSLDLQLEIDFDDIGNKREQYTKEHTYGPLYKEPEFVIIKIAVPIDATLYGIPVKWEFF
mgnify:CR=1 FL=1